MDKVKKYDEFNLDIQNIKVNSEVSIAGSATFSCNETSHCNTLATCVNGCSEKICAC